MHFVVADDDDDFLRFDTYSFDVADSNRHWICRAHEKESSERVGEAQTVQHTIVKHLSFFFLPFRFHFIQ